MGHWPRNSDREGALLMMGNAQKTWCLLLAATSLLAGCSVLIESDKKQCTKDSQCDLPYVCGDNGLCEVKTGCTVENVKDYCREDSVCIDGECTVAACTTSDGCDDDKLCDITLGTCVRTSAASCSETKDCARYEGAEACIKTEKSCTGPQCKKLCGDAQCKTAAQCTDESPTAVCNAGACEDPTWGCLGVKDPRKTATSSKEASFKVKVLYGFAQAGETETGVKDLKVRVCQFGDALCANPVTTDDDITYGDDHYLVIKGLESGLYYKVQLLAMHPVIDGLALYPTEYLMYRTVVEETVDPKPILMYQEDVFDSTSRAAGVKRDRDLGLLLMRIFDCTDIEVAGVQVSSGSTTTGCGVEACPTTVFYQNTGNIPDPGATQTNAAGRAGIINLRPEVFNRITLTRAADGKRITSFSITPRANWLTYVFFWPWDYGTAAD